LTWFEAVNPVLAVPLKVSVAVLRGLLPGELSVTVGPGVVALMLIVPEAVQENAGPAVTVTDTVAPGAKVVVPLGALTVPNVHPSRPPDLMESSIVTV
jgi:hypothetical protein